MTSFRVQASEPSVLGSIGSVPILDSLSPHGELVRTNLEFADKPVLTKYGRSSCGVISLHFKPGGATRL
jgi:hypothetical protein